MIEIILAAATLLGGAAAAWYLYDRWSGKAPRPITERDLASLEARLESLLKVPAPSLATESVIQAKSEPSDALLTQIRKLLAAREALISRLAALADARDKPIPKSDISYRLAELNIPKTFEDAARRVLDFTADLSRVHRADLQHSEWVVQMADACIGFLDVTLRNLRDSGAAGSGA